MPEQNNGFEGQDHHPDRRIDIVAARKMLGMIGKNYSDSEISEILEVLYGIAEEAFEMYSNEPDPDDSSE